MQTISNTLCRVDWKGSQQKSHTLLDAGSTPAPATRFVIQDGVSRCKASGQNVSGRKECLGAALGGVQVLKHRSFPAPVLASVHYLQAKAGELAEPQESIKKPRSAILTDSCGGEFNYPHKNGAREQQQIAAGVKRVTKAAVSLHCRPSDRLPGVDGLQPVHVFEKPIRSVSTHGEDGKTGYWTAEDSCRVSRPTFSLLHPKLGTTWKSSLPDQSRKP